ncbi:MAG: histidine kinase dimerization/phospho-acceptor domain-containing protein, partial [Myxococcota bacterium]|nr:histidine kinase dimerization/phospho-acceptor domain-containing protein [Myxococcota bacterium]
MPRDLGDVLEAILAGVLIVDRFGRIEELNSTACRMLEHSPEAVRGTSVDALLEPDHPVARLARQVVETGIGVSEIDCRLERRSGSDVTVDVAGSPLFDDAGEPDGAVLVLRDRSAHRRLERLEAERERLAAFGRIAAGIAHEIKNPLGGIRGAGELLAQRAADDKTRETAELVVREAARITSLVDDFMVFARGDRLRLAPVNVHRVLDGVLDLLEHDPLSHAVRIVRAYDPSIPELLADPDRLTQVFLNLTRNALQAMEKDGGTLTVRTRMTLDHRIVIDPGSPAVPTLAVWIEDTGCGMDEDALR